MKAVPTKVSRNRALPGSRKASLRVGPTSTCEARRPNCSPCCDQQLERFVPRRWSRPPMPFCTAFIKGELAAILKQCPPAPEVVPQGRRWQDWDIYPAAEQLDRFFPPVRVLLILDNLAGHKSYRLVQWCAEHGILLLYTPTAGSWLNMAESLQRIIQRRALSGQHPADAQTLMSWLTDAVEGWNRHPTPFIWGGKRHARRDRAYARRHRLGGSGATTRYVLPQRIRSVLYYKRAA